ncbi:MAG: ArsR/SmtB family transcription factor [Desulfovibrionales bacterium]
MNEITQLCKAVGDETRIRLINVLSKFELNVGEIVSVLEIGQPRVSRHLKILSDAGLLQSRRDGLWVFYCTMTENPGREFVKALKPFLKSDSLLRQDMHRAHGVVEERVQATRRFFDTVAHKWPTMSAEILGDLDLAVEIMHRMPDCDVAVDLGCGPGDLLPTLSRRAYQVIGVDNSRKMLDLASQRVARSGKVSLRIGDMAHLPLKDGEAGFAVMSMVLHHLDSPQAALRETARILVPGGRLVIADFSSHENEAMRAQYGDRWLGFGTQRLQTWLEQSGFVFRDATPMPVRKGLTLVLTEAIKRDGGT